MKIILPTLAALALLVPASALAAADHRGEVRTVCWSSTWVEHAPADHPVAPAYKGDHFRVTRGRYHVARHQLWADGVLTTHDAKAGKTWVHRGWIRVAALRGC